MRSFRSSPRASAVVVVLLFASAAWAQRFGEVRGAVSMKETGGPLHGAEVLIVELGRSTLSDDEGRYSFRRVPPGRYHVVTHLDSLFTEAARVVEVAAGETATADFLLGLTEQKYSINVTASGKEETEFESFNSVESYDAYDLTLMRDASLGEALDQQVGSGIAKRGFGPGASRPIIRGFDGDRVLIMEDGIRTGTLSSQSGDHGEVVNTALLERLEVVKGPATLLYSGNAMGGTVNAVSRHHEMHRHPHKGLRGFLSGSGGTANSLGGGSGGFEYGIDKWMIWGSAGGTRTSDFDSPQGEIFGSRTRAFNSGGGFGWFGAKTYFSFDFKLDDGEYGVPFAAELEALGSEAEEASEEEEEELERVSIDTERKNYRFNWGLNDLGSFVDRFEFKFNYTDWKHDEVEFFEDGETEVGTSFDNQQFVYRGVFEQAKRGPLTGRFGFWGISRDYDVAGEEALSPPIDETGFAVFGLEELDFERFKLQFGGRLETKSFDPVFGRRVPEGEDASGVPDAVERDFTGASAAAGVHVNLWRDGAFVANYAHTYRPPALEELFNFGPHLGNVAFEIGDPSLRAETGDGVDLSLRHQGGRLRGELNLFRYSFNNFVFPFLTGEIEDGLQVTEFTQRDARFTGAEANLGFGLRPGLWLNLGADFVDAQETELDTPLPRIPPLRGKIGLDYTYKGLRLVPELVLANQQQQTFTDETRTPGYAVMNFKATYTYAQPHLAHQFSVNFFNIGDQLYRNHSSFIKDFAPEIGRGVRFTYMVRFF